MVEEGAQRLEGVTVGRFLAALGVDVSMEEAQAVAELAATFREVANAVREIVPPEDLEIFGVPND